MKKYFFVFFVSFICLLGLSGQGLEITSNDLRLEYESPSFAGNTGYHLYIRKKPAIESVILTETTKDTSGKADNYAYRATEYNSINGNEVRLLNGKPLTSEYSKYSLIDSTPEPDKQFGAAFHIYIPQKLLYGYPWTRNGQVEVSRGLFINIRTFEKKYGDYTGSFYDNPFMFDLGTPPAPTPPPVTPATPPAVLQEKEVPILSDDYNDIAVQKFHDIADFGGGKIIYSKGPETIIDDIMDSLKRLDPKKDADVVFAIDATGSMKDDIQKLRQEWVPRLINDLKDFKSVRLGLLLYRDYGDNFSYEGLPVKFFPFTQDTGLFIKNLNGFNIRGVEGGDVPEAVYEALFASMEYFKWQQPAQKKVILIGDAPPHSTPRGKKIYTKDFVNKMAQEKQITIDAIITPDDKAKRKTK